MAGPMCGRRRESNSGIICETATVGLLWHAFHLRARSYAQGRGKPEDWGQDWPGFGQRFGSASAVTAIDGNVRYGMEMLFKEDMRYIPCHGCS